MFDQLLNWLMARGMGAEMAIITTQIGALLFLILISMGVGWLARGFLLRGLKQLIKESDAEWDDLLFKYRVFQRLVWLLPLAIFSAFATPILTNLFFAEFAQFVQLGIVLWITIIVVLTLNGVLNTVHAISRRRSWSTQIPIRGLIQTLRVLLYFLGGLFFVTIAFAEDPLVLLSSFGALFAVLSFVFRDPILGLVAGLQLTSGKLLAVGDFIEVPSFEAAGTVLEIGLTTVKVRNSDNTITTVPTYALISDTFKNWRGLDESNGRLIQKQILIDIHSLHPLNAEQRSTLTTRGLISADTPAISTNLAALRHHLSTHLADHPAINPELLHQVRQLPPTAHGTPLELYAFTHQKDWVAYEHVVADLLNYTLAILPEFNLKAYQASAPLV